MPRLTGLNTNLAPAALGTATATLTLANSTAQDQAVQGLPFFLPPASAYLFDMRNSGTCSTPIDMLLQVKQPDGNWQDLCYVVTATTTIRRATWYLPMHIALPNSNNVMSSAGLRTGGGTFIDFRDTGASVNGAAVTPLLASGGQGADVLQPVENFAFRLIGVPRSAALVTGDTITLQVTAVVE